MVWMYESWFIRCTLAICCLRYQMLLVIQFDSIELVSNSNWKLWAVACLRSLFYLLIVFTNERRVFALRPCRVKVAVCVSVTQITECVDDCRDRVKKLLICWLFVRRECMRFICLIRIDSFHMHHAISFLFLFFDQYSQCNCCLPSNICVCRFIYILPVNSTKNRARFIPFYVCHEFWFSFLVMLSCAHDFHQKQTNQKRSSRQKRKNDERKMNNNQCQSKTFFLTPN